VQAVLKFPGYFQLTVRSFHPSPERSRILQYFPLLLRLAEVEDGFEHEHGKRVFVSGTIRRKNPFLLRL
jgi:hypothetical protein